MKNSFVLIAVLGLVGALGCVSDEVASSSRIVETVQADAGSETIPPEGTEITSVEEDGTEYYYYDGEWHDVPPPEVSEETYVEAATDEADEICDEHFVRYLDFGKFA